MQGNLITMPNHVHNDNPEGIAALWRAVHSIEKKISSVERSIGFRSGWSRAWSWVLGERNWLFPIVFTVIAGICGGAWYIAGLILDNHIRDGLKPVEEEIKGITRRLDNIDASLQLIPAQITVSKYSAIPPQDLKAHATELKQLKNTLAGVKHDVPGFWPTSFELINLLSEATTSVKKEHAPIDLTDIHGLEGAKPPGPQIIGYPKGSVLKLHGTIENVTFTEAIVYLDSNVVLRNVTFIKCKLVLPSDVKTPPKPLEQIANQLLQATDFTDLKLTVS